jgi:hypothetical protein
MYPTQLLKKVVFGSTKVVELHTLKSPLKAPLVKNTYFKLFCPNLMKLTQYVQKKVLRLIGYKGHQGHTGDHVDPAFIL